jgi:hypothetical protein
MFPLHNNYNFRSDYFQTLTLKYRNAPGYVLQRVQISNFISAFEVSKRQRGYSTNRKYDLEFHTEFCRISLQTNVAEFSVNNSPYLVVSYKLIKSSA